MAVQPQTPFKEYTANGTTTVFPLDFDCENKDHLIVMIDDAETDNSTWSLNNKQVTFNAAPSAGKKITLQRNTPYRRDRNYQAYDNSFRPDPVNKDFDWIWWKLQELGVADWILGNRINALKNYVDRKDDELKAYLMEEIRKQGVALDQLDDYYNYLMQRLAQIAVDKGWDASFVIDGDKTQKQINFEIKTYLDNFPFYIPYSPLVDDYADQIELAIQVGRPILFTQDATYVVKRKIAINSLTKALNITGNNAIIKYDGPADLDRIFEIQHSMPLDHVIYSLEFDANLKASSCLRIHVTNNNEDGESNFYANRLKAKNCHKSAISQPGDAIALRGSFRNILFEYPEIHHVSMAPGVGREGTSGITGLTVWHWNDTSYPKFLELRGPKISKIYSQDPTYTMDQDGVRFFGGRDASKRHKSKTKLLIYGGEFLNCWGRSVKTQCRYVLISGSSMVRTEGNATKAGNSEIDVQTGNAHISGVTFDYSNGYTGGPCIHFGTGAEYNNTGGTATGCEVYLDDSTILEHFVSNYPREGVDQTIIATENKIHGKAKRFARTLVNGSKNRFIYSENQVEEIVAAQHVENGQLVKAFNVSLASGSGTPRGSHIEMKNNAVLSSLNDVHLSYDNIANFVVQMKVSASGNVGFIDDIKGSDSAGLRTRQVSRASAFGSFDSRTNVTMQEVAVSAGQTAVIQFAGPAGGMFMLGFGSNGYSQAIASIVGGAFYFLANHNVTDAAGAVTTRHVYYANAQPATPQGLQWDMWQHEDQGGKYYIRNNTGSNRGFNVMAIVMT